MTLKTPEECEQAVLDYIEKHYCDYTEHERNYIKRNLSYLEKNKRTLNIRTPHFLRQIYDELGIIPDNENMYHGFVKLLEEKMDINRDVIEVASGIIPNVTRRVALRQKSGSITSYDPRLTVQTAMLPNMTIKREYFTSKTKVKPNSLLFGFMPCEATIDIIESAAINNADFMIGLCEGGSRKKNYWLEYEDEWLGFVNSYANTKFRKRDDVTIETASLSDYGDPYPVIYTKHK